MINYTGDDDEGDFHPDLDVSWQESPSDDDDQVAEVIRKPPEKTILVDKKMPIAPKPTSDQFIRVHRGRNVSQSEDDDEDSLVIGSIGASKFPFISRSPSGLTSQLLSKPSQLEFETSQELDHLSNRVNTKSSASETDQSLASAWKTIASLRDLLRQSQATIQSQEREIRMYRRQLGLSASTESQHSENRSNHEELLSSKHKRELEQIMSQIEIVRMRQSHANAELMAIRSQMEFSPMFSGGAGLLNKPTVSVNTTSNSNEYEDAFQLQQQQAAASAIARTRLTASGRFYRNRNSSDSGNCSQVVDTNSIREKMQSVIDAKIQQQPAKDMKDTATLLSMASQALGIADLINVDQLLVKLRSLNNDRKKWEYYASRLLRDMIARDEFYLSPSSPGVTHTVNNFQTEIEHKWACFALKLVDELLTVCPERLRAFDLGLLEARKPGVTQAIASCR